MSPSTAPIAWPDAARHQAFERWLESVAPPHGLRRDTLRAASADASFRRYFRIDGAQHSFIVMDAPPSHEDVRPFVHIAELHRSAEILWISSSSQNDYGQ